MRLDCVSVMMVNTCIYQMSKAVNGLGLPLTCFFSVLLAVRGSDQYERKV